jgi:hypothetical protein
MLPCTIKIKLPQYFNCQTAGYYDQAEVNRKSILQLPAKTLKVKVLDFPEI